MKSRFAIVARRIISALIISVLTSFCSSVLAADGWQRDIQFQSCQCTASDDSACACDDACSCGCVADVIRCRRTAAIALTARCRTNSRCRMTPVMKSMYGARDHVTKGLTQFYQGVASGGADEEFDLGGKVDQFLILDSCKMGLWDGTTMTMLCGVALRRGRKFRCRQLGPS